MKLILIDGNSIFFRAYYATAYGRGPLMQNKEGVYTNALFAFVNMLEKILETDYTHVLVAFDTGKPTFRHLANDDYKKGRAPMPEEMVVQIPLIHEYLAHKQIEDVAIDGYEADDIIGTLAEKASKEMKVEIYSSDKDLLQLVSDQITVKLIKKGISEIESVTPKSFYETYQIDHSLMVDLKALMGDNSDNIKGVPGVGEKTAIKLLQQYGSLENIFKNKDNIGGKLGESIRNSEEIAEHSYFLSKIETNVPTKLEVSDLVKKEVNLEELINFYQRMDLHSFVKRIDVVEEVKEEITYKVINNDNELAKIIKEGLAVHIELYDDNYHLSDIVGFGLSDGKSNYFLSKEYALSSTVFKNYLESNMTKYTYDLKAFIVKMLWHNIKIKGFEFDFLLASYLNKPHLTKQEFKINAATLEFDEVDYEEIIYGKGAKKALPEKAIYELHVCKKARAIFKLRKEILKELETNNQLSLLNDVEIPLSYVLGEMEFSGILVDQNLLKALKADLKVRLTKLEEEIYLLANKKFNINSPKQLGEVLFVDLGLETGKKTKTKSYSTNVEVLMKLIDDHPVIKYILEYRQLAKLYSTYIEGIENTLFSDGKVHTIYTQALTATGRLSSLEPNLQNIPTKTLEGRQIRKLFVPRSGYIFIGADYSQIELRVLAHMSKSIQLLKDFNDNLDIHSETAKKVFNVSEVNDEERRRAKAVNFGIIYGMGSFSLSEDLEITRSEAQDFINKYFEVYPDVKVFLDDKVASATNLGYVETILNRRRYIPELSSPVFPVREFGKRTAMNAPIQGSAADIIKVAMIKLDNYLKENKLKSKILLQVHDELILEVPLYEEEHVKRVLKEIMEKAITLEVNLKVNVAKGESWFDL